MSSLFPRASGSLKAGSTASTIPWEKGERESAVFICKILIAEADRKEERINVSGERFVHEGILRKGEFYTLDISAGMPEDATLEAVVTDRKDRKEVSRVSLKLPKTDRGAFSGRLRIPARKEGIFDIRLLLNGTPLPKGTVPEFSMAVIDASALPRKPGSLKKSLLYEIDCAKQPPDFSGGGKTGTVRKRFGSYRESGDVSWLSHMNSQEPSWFAYRIRVPEAQKPYLVASDRRQRLRRTAGGRFENPRLPDRKSDSASGNVILSGGTRIQQLV